MVYSSARAKVVFLVCLLTLGLSASPAFAALQVAFTQQSPSLAIGQAGTWEVTVTNPDPTAVNGATLTVTLPNQFTVSDPGGGTETTGPPHTIQWTFNIPASGNVKRTFQARPDCAAETGQDITALVTPGNISAISSPIAVKPPLVDVTLLDTTGSTVTTGSVGTTVTWYLTISNSGPGDLVQGADGNFTLGDGFTFVSITSLDGHNTPGSLIPGTPVWWNTGEILSGSQAKYEIKAVISGCNPLDLIDNVAVNWTDGSHNCLPTAGKTTSASIALVIREPQISITLSDPSPIDYCDGSDGNITITNLSSDGPADLFELEIAGFPNTWTIAPITPGVTFDEATSTFKNIPKIDPLGSLILKYHIGAKAGVCPPGPSAVLVFKPKYTNECGAVFGTVYFPPIVGPISWAMQPPVTPTFTVNKSGPTSAKLGDKNLTYNITVTYSGPADKLPYVVNITDTYPAGFTLTSFTPGGSDNGTAITWSGVSFSALGLSKSYTVTMDAPAVTNPCAAFKAYTNTVTVNSVPDDCRGCPGVIHNSTLTTFVNDVKPGIVDSSVVSVPGGDVCSTLTPKTCYTFGTNAPASWSGISLNNQVTPIDPKVIFLSITQVEVNGTPYSGCGTVFPLDLSCLDATAAPKPNVGVTLCVTYNYDVQNAAGTYTDQSALLLPDGYGTGCAGSPEYNVAAGFTVAGSSMTVAAYSPSVLNSCDNETFHIDLGGSGTLYNAQVVLDIQGNYRYMDSISFSGIQNESGASIPAFEPDLDLITGKYIWNFPVPIKPQGTISFRMLQLCGAQGEWNVRGRFNNKCEQGTLPQVRSATPNPATSAPILIRSGLPTLHLVPAQIFADTRFPREDLYIVNGGSGPMYNTVLTVSLDPDLAYYLHAVLIGPAPDTVTVSPDKRTATFAYNVIPAGEQRALRVTDQLLGCDNLTITATVTWGCDKNGDGKIETCAERTKSTEVLLPTSELLVVDHSGTKLDYCGDENGTLSITASNLSKSDVYNVKLQELLPPGVTYIRTTSAVNTNGYGTGLTGPPTVTLVNNYNGTGRQQITWDFSNVLPFNTEIVPARAMKPGSDVTVAFTVRFADCAAAATYAASNKKAEASATFDPPCNFINATSILKSPARVLTTSPDEPNVTVAKGGRNVTKGVTTFNGTQVSADQNDTIEWQITVTSNGNYHAKDVTVTDTLPTNVTYVAGSGKLDGATVLPDTWYGSGYNLGTMEPSASHVITFRTKVNAGGCTIDPTINKANIVYGCCGAAPMQKTGQSSVSLVTEPNFGTGGGALTLVDQNWNTCGGQVIITLTNTGSTALFQTIKDTLPVPPGYVFDPSGACNVIAANTPPGVTHVPALNCTGVGGSTPTWTSSNIDAVYPGETITISFYVKTDGTYCDTNGTNDSGNPDVPIPPLTNKADYSFKSSCGEDFALSKSDTFNALQPDIDIVKSPATQITAPGGTSSWTITLTNKGNAPASNITLTDVLGNGFSNPTANPTASWSGNTGTWNIPGPINPGGTWTVTVTAKPGSGSLFDHATVEGMCKDQGGANTCTYTHDEAKAFTAGFDLTKTVNKASANIGEELAYTVAARFINTDLFKTVTIVDTLPPNTTFISATQSDGNFTIVPTQVGQKLTWNLGDFNGPKTFRYLVKVRVNNVPANAGGTVLTNSVKADFSIDFGPEGTATFSQTRSVTTTLHEPKLHLLKTITPNSGIQADSPVTIALKATNNGDGPAYKVDVGDLVNDTNGDGVYDPSQDVTVYNCNSINLGAAGTDYPAGFSAAVTGIAPGCRVTYTSLGDSSLAAGASPTFTFKVNVDGNVPTGSLYTDTATTQGWSLPPSDSESGNTIYDRKTNAKSAADIRIESTSLLDKVIVTTSEPSTQGNNVAIGEVVTYRMPFTFPGGITRTVTIADAIPAGLAYIPGSALLDRDSDNITVQTNPGGINGNVPGNPVAVTLNTSIPGTLSLTLGDVLSLQGAHKLFLTLNCVVKNISTTQGGTPLSDQAQIQWKDDDNVTYTTLGNPLVVTAVTPVPAIDKDASPQTGQAGDSVTFTLKLCNSGTLATAFDWIFRDPLPSLFANPQFIEANTSGADNATVSFCSGKTSYFTGNNLCGLINRVNPGGCVLFKYSAQFTQEVVFGQTVTNTARFTTTSIPGDHGTGGATPGNPGTDTGKRTGDGSGPNGLFGQDSVTETIDVPTMSKAILSFKDWYSIGDLVTYQITVGVPSGTTTNFKVQDVLPLGLTYVDDNVTIPSGFLPNPPPAASWDSGIRTVTWDFASVTQPPPAGNLVIKYRARVLNISQNHDGVSLSNKATLTYGDPAKTISSSKSITVGEPNLTMQKTPQTTPLGLAGGSTIRYRVEFRNNGNTTAYQEIWNEVLPFHGAGPPVDGLGKISNPSLTIVTGSVNLNNTPNALTVGNLTLGTTHSDNDTISLPPFQMSPESYFYVEFDCLLLPGVVAGDLYTNLTDVTSKSQPLNGPDVRDGGASASSTLQVDSTIRIEKSLPSGANGYAIGQQFNYLLRVWVIPGISPGVVVTDTLPAGLKYITHLVSVPSPSLTFEHQIFAQSGQDLSFDFGNVTNTSPIESGADDYFDIRVTVLVQNVSGNQQGKVFDNNATVEFHPENEPPVIETSNTVKTSVTEPALIVQKIPTPSVQSRTNLVTYTMTVSHDGTSTAPAYDLVVKDTLPAGLTFFSTTVAPANFTRNGQNLTFRNAVLALGTTWTFSYEVRIDDNATLSTPLTNNVRLTWASTPGATGGEDSGRTGDGGLNDYKQTTQAGVTAAAPDLRIAKSDGGITAVPGGIIPYKLTYQNLGTWDATGVVLTETVPTGTTFNDGNSTPGWTCLPDGNPSSVCTYAVADPLRHTYPPATIVFALKVKDPFPAGIVQVINRAVIADNGKNGPDAHPEDQNATDETPVDAAPYLEITKTDGADSAVPGQQLSYALTITNSGNQDAAGILVTDTIPDHTKFVSASNGGAETSAGSGVVKWPGFILSGEGGTTTLTVTVKVDNPIAAGVEEITNFAKVFHPRNANPDDNATDTDTIEASPQFTIEKTHGPVVLGPGSQLTYNLTIRNIGNQDGDNAVITDILPAGVIFVSATPIYTQTPDPPLPPETLTWKNISLKGGGGVMTLQVTIGIPDPVPAGMETVTNQAVVSHPSGSNSTQITDPVVAAPSLKLVKTSSAAMVHPGQALTYTLTITNVGRQNAAGVILTDTLPSETTFASASNGGYVDAPGRIVTWPPFDVPGDNATAFRTVTVNISNPVAAGVKSLTNVAKVSYGQSQTQVTLPVSVTVPDLTLTKKGPAAITPGRIIQYTLTYANVGNWDATGVVVTETVPEHTTFNKAQSSPGWSCADGAPADTQCTFSVGSLPVKKSGQVKFAVKVDASYKEGSVENTASVKDDESNGKEPTPEKNVAHFSTHVQVPVVPALDEGGKALFLLMIVVAGVLVIHRRRTRER
jgi:uncharacterized repeat protein (TIGR01451 family)/fimbrial isopeptide formation D2 family protein